MLVQNIDQFRKSRRHIDTLFIFDPLEPLAQDFLDDLCIFLDVFIVLIQIQKQRDKRRLPVRRHQRIDLILDCLDAGAEFVVNALFHHFFDHVRIKRPAKPFVISRAVFVRTLP